MKLWDARFKQTASKTMELLNNSLDIDKELAMEDIQGSLAYAQALHKTGVLSRNECNKIVSSLKKINTMMLEGKPVLSPGG
ncbi:MAG: hypothetical protein ABIA63_04185 [bacterium]